MPNLQNQKDALARLIQKNEKTPEDMAQIKNLEAKIANKPSSSQRPPIRPRASRSYAKVVKSPPRRAANASQPMGVMSVEQYLDASWRNFKASTTAGKAWGTIVMHPPSKPPSDYAGVPDADSSNRVSLRLETTTTVGWDETLFDTSQTGATTYSLQIMAPDIPEAAFIYRLRNDKTGEWSNTRIYNHSLVNTSNNTDLATGTNASYGIGEQGVSTYRIAASSLTCAFTGPKLADQGESYCGQIVPDHRHDDFASIAPIVSAALPIEPYAGEDSWGQNFTIPDTPQVLVQRDPGSMTGAARDGCFIPLKYETPLTGYQYEDAESGDVFATSDDAGSTTGNRLGASGLLRLSYSDDIAKRNFVSAVFDKTSRIVAPSGKTYAFSNAAGVKTFSVAYSTHSGMQWGVAFFTGLTIGASGVGAASFQVTRYTYLDLHISGNQLINAVSRSPPMYDDLAIRSVIRLHQIMPSAYPAICNGFMDWVRKAFSWLSSNRGTIKDVVSLLPLPGAGIAGDLIEAGLPTANALLNGGALGP